MDEVQALWASVVGVSPLPNVLADYCFDVRLIDILTGIEVILGRCTWRLMDISALFRHPNNLSEYLPVMGLLVNKKYIWLEL